MAYTSNVLARMLTVRAPYVQYASLEELVGLCVNVVDAYAGQVDMVMREIWNEAYMTKKWCGYDRLILGIFCFDDVLVVGIDSTLRSTKNRGALYACLLHREVCAKLNECTRDYIHSTQVPNRAELLTALSRVLTSTLLLGGNSHMLRLLEPNFVRCADARGDMWLVCPRHKLPEYMLAICMSQHKRLGRGAVLCEIPADLLRDILGSVFASTSWDLHPMDANVKVSVPV